MLREVIGTSSISEIYKIGVEAKRGILVVKNESTKVAAKADAEGVDVWFLDADNQPTGHLADVEVSQYDPEMDTVKENEYALLKKYPVGASIATDQVSGTFTVGGYAIAGTGVDAGLLVPAVATNVSTLKYVGEYQDGDKTLQRFEFVNPHTVA
ncbi:hypothetical protein [uncultured Metabacillus sp.]|uniref:hypothetical protein n=1 Tax=uncultured Metabacillus sp. TaxID=2860135 RepID=UPI00262DFB61|nr:hypothetical protein [uncultured Metabacillus sp.]